MGLRYSLAREHSFFVSFITWVSLLGVAVGVAALITVLSVMNGFESELRGTAPEPVGACHLERRRGADSRLAGAIAAAAGRAGPARALRHSWTPTPC